MQAPGEAEAQCAALVKSGKVFATGTEDMDALTFGSSVLLRHLTFSEARLGLFLNLLICDKIGQGFCGEVGKLVLERASSINNHVKTDVAAWCSPLVCQLLSNPPNHASMEHRY